MMSNKHIQFFGITLESVQLLLAQPSQQGKERVGKGNWTDPSMMPNNRLCPWTGLVEVA
jgi:hypothetical protein